jgi:hypothetical protein
MMSTTYPRGKYQAKVIDQGFEQAASTGTVCFFMQLLVLGRYDEQGNLQECPKFERSYKQYLANETGINILKGDLKSLGVEATDLVQLNLDSQGAISLRDRTIDVVCDHETYKGKVVERWQFPRTRKKLDLDSVRALNDKFGHLLQGGNGQPKPPTPPAKPNDSDVPF